MTQTFYLDLTMTRHEPSSRSSSDSKPKVPDRYILQTLVLLVPVSDQALEKLHEHFPNIHYFPDGDISKGGKKVLEEGEVWFTGTEAFPSVIKSIEDVPKARVVQLASGESTRYSRQHIDM